jgi:hypothetical protein
MVGIKIGKLILLGVLGGTVDVERPLDESIECKRGTLTSFQNGRTVTTRSCEIHHVYRYLPPTVTTKFCITDKRNTVCNEGIPIPEDPI